MVADLFKGECNERTCANVVLAVATGTGALVHGVEGVHVVADL